ncbi:MAG: C4-dicarboxylic acid transporter DauA [Holophagaceae bacterium]|nr:C4-dicarboxylic acid transporter DauA [Holophagaceae bacterium]
MARTYEPDPIDGVPLSRLPAAALRAVLKEGYTRAQFKKDAMAGFVVGVVALPLAMALSIAVGAPPQQGIYTAIVAGFIAAVLGGSRVQVVGPTAAFIVLLAPIQARYGLGGLLLTGLMSGAILLALGLLRLGSLIEFIPHPVTTGFTAGIAVVIGALQLKDVLGLRIEHMPEHFAERMVAIGRALPTASVWEALVAALTLAILLVPRLPKRLLIKVLPKYLRPVPAPLIALPFAALAAFLLMKLAPGFHVETIGSRFHTLVNGVSVPGVPQAPPWPILPWNQAGPGGGDFELSFGVVRALLPGAFAVAMLGAIESLLSAVVADGMARTKHDPDAELIGLGVANLVAPFFGGIPATGAIARTATNFRSGGRSPIASMIHALTLLLIVLLLAPLIAFVPMASLAALLLLVAWNMSEAEHFVHTVKVAPRSDVAVLLTCFFLTVVFDMVIAVSVGVVFASLLFMRRMAHTTQGDLVEADPGALPGPLPAGVVIYDISGPLFFGAAERAMGALRAIDSATRAVIFRLERVPNIDATGLVAFESAISELNRHHIKAILVGLQPQAARLMVRAGIVADPGRVAICADMVEAFKALGAPLRETRLRPLRTGRIQIHIQARKLGSKPRRHTG